MSARVINTQTGKVWEFETAWMAEDFIDDQLEIDPHGVFDGNYLIEEDSTDERHLHD